MSDKLSESEILANIDASTPKAENFVERKIIWLYDDELRLSGPTLSSNN
jgi:hypothetical protein